VRLVLRINVILVKHIVDGKPGTVTMVESMRVLNSIGCWYENISFV
jgi:hypothetical protein